MIGIAGGAGPLAGAELFRQIINETAALKDQDHLPVILESLPDQIPDRTEFLKGIVKENPALGLSKVLLRLENAGATVAGISCNTAHAPVIFEEIQKVLAFKNSELKVLNMVSETLRFLETNFSKDTPVGILSSTGTWKNKIYANQLEHQDYTVIRPETLEEQQQIHAAIYDNVYGVKSTGTVISTQAKTILYGEANKLIERGAKVIILACTEIPLVITDDYIFETFIIDTSKILARSLITHYAPEKLKDLNLSHE